MKLDKKSEQILANLRKRIDEVDTKKEVLKNLDFFILDNSIRESTVGQLRAHTIENKWQIWNQIQRCGFEHLIVGSFSEMTRVDDLFIKQLVSQTEDVSKLYGFSEVYGGGVVDGVPDTEKLPIGMTKIKELGLQNVIFEMDLANPNIDVNKFPAESICSLLLDRLKWVYTNIHPKSRVFINFRDLPDTITSNPELLFQVIEFVCALESGQRPWGLLYEDSGKTLPEVIGKFTEAIRAMMNAYDWSDGHLLVHIHERWGLADCSQLECLSHGANGVWASVITEGAAIGHASSTVSLMNLIRVGNKKVLKKYNCQDFRDVARNVCQITTGRPPHPDQPIYGDRSLDTVFDFGFEDATAFDMAGFFGVKPTIRISNMSSNKMIIEKLEQSFGQNEQFNEEIAYQMRQVMLEDLSNNRKEEYMSDAGLAILFDRSGGKLTEKMGLVLANANVRNSFHEQLLAEVRTSWDDWDKCDKTQSDDALEFPHFYNAFMSPYFGCFYCEDTRKSLKCLDMDSDGQIDWYEFKTYLMWALRQYPEVETAEGLLYNAFVKGIMPAMRDEIMKK